MKKKYQMPVTRAIRLDVNDMLAVSNPSISEGPSMTDLETEVNGNVWEDLW